MIMIIFYRYKALCPATWPHWRGEPADGVLVLVQHLGYFPNEYKMGRSEKYLHLMSFVGLSSTLIMEYIGIYIYGIYTLLLAIIPKNDVKCFLSSSFSFLAPLIFAL